MGSRVYPSASAYDVYAGAILVEMISDEVFADSMNGKTNEPALQRSACIILP